jgi:hypothetical protein
MPGAAVFIRDQKNTKKMLKAMHISLFQCVTRAPDWSHYGDSQLYYVEWLSKSGTDIHRAIVQCFDEDTVTILCEAL